MTGLIITLVVVALVAAVVVVMRRRSPSPRAESLGAPSPDIAVPLIREESRHHDSPAAGDVEKPGGREHDKS